jgi:hypothetical protein
MEYYNNILCVKKKEIVKYSGGEIVPATTYDYQNWSNRGQLVVVKRGCYGQEALYRFDKLRPDVQRAMKEHYGGVDGTAKDRDFVELIVVDGAARRFFKSHLLDNGRHLSDEKIAYYTHDASVLNALKIRYDKVVAARRSKGKKTMPEGFWVRALRAVKSVGVQELYPNNVAKIQHARSLERKFRTYLDTSYISLVSGREANQNALKIEQDGGEWLVARFATPVNRVSLAQLYDAYNELAADRGWKVLQSVDALRNYLYREDVKPYWYGMRYGELKFKEKYTRQHRTLLPTRRDSLWYSDGTKLNYYYLDSNGKMATCNVYEVMDVYSEKLLGYHISRTEDFEAQYNAFKMAIQVAGYKPYEMRYDNQGGHKKLAASNFLHNLSKLSIPTQPYNGKSKTIESAFRRLQEQFLKKDWFFTGQNITAKKAESRVNMEFTLHNWHELPTLQEVEQRYKQRRNEWNEAKHHSTGLSRNQTYYQSTNEGTEKVEIWEMMDLFWLTTKEPSTYRASGIEIQVKKQKYSYEVLDAEGVPDSGFMLRNVDKQFYVKYDPTEMSVVGLYDLDSSQAMRFVSFAQPYLKIHRAIQDQLTGEALFLKAQEIANKSLRVAQQDYIEDLMEKYELHPSQQGLCVPAPKGLSKKDKAKQKPSESLGQHYKQVSNVLAELEQEEDNLYNLI